MRAIAIYLQIKVVADGSYEILIMLFVAFSKECNAYDKIKLSRKLSFLYY
jgi:hypothetical protein